MQLGWRVSGLGGKLERHDSLSPWNLFHRTNTDTGARRFSFVMESCPQNKNRHWSDKILFRHGIFSTEQTQTLEREDSLSSWNLFHRTNTDTGATRFSFFMVSCPRNEHINSSRCLHKIWRSGVCYYTHPCSWLSAVSTPCTFRSVTVHASALHFSGILGFVLKPPYLCLRVLKKWQPNFRIKVWEFQRSENYYCVIVCYDTVLIAKWLQTSCRERLPACFCLKEERP
jgi:hypothetical protein